MTRSIRRCAALTGTFALLFATLSVAAHACPMDSETTASAISTMPEGCPDRDDRANLCKAHCTAGPQQTGHTAPDLPPMPLVHGLPATPVVSALLAVFSARAAVGATPAPATDPPIAIRNCCFRL